MGLGSFLFSPDPGVMVPRAGTLGGLIIMATPPFRGVLLGTSGLGLLLFTSFFFLFFGGLMVMKLDPPLGRGLATCLRTGFAMEDDVLPPLVKTGEPTCCRKEV